MVRLNHERILLIGDRQRELQSALAEAAPTAHVTVVPTVFDGIAELVANPYTTVMAAAEPIERRAEAAVKTLRQLAAGGRVLLFGHPMLEPLSRRMLEFGCDDYLVTPAGAGELQQMLGTPPLRLANEAADTEAEASTVQVTPTVMPVLSAIPLAELFMDAMLQHPNSAPTAAVKQLNTQLGSTMRLHYAAVGEAVPASAATAVISHAVRAGSEQFGTLCLTIPADHDEAPARHFLSQVAHLFGKAAALQDRHNKLQKLAITDELTGIYNGRFFRHFLQRIILKAKTDRFPVTLLLFDIDNFKRYNDQHGHGVGDEILKQTATLMRRCCREHDCVARISGDEFAVVFWEKEGPRQPLSGKSNPPPSRIPQTPRQIADRFRNLLASSELSALGPTGQGVLTISGGMAVFPYDAQDVPALIEAADRALMFGAKQAGKNSIFLVGSEEEPGEI